MGWLHDGGVSFQLVTIKPLSTLVLSKHVDTLFILMDPDYIWIFLEAILLLCQVYLHEVFQGFEF